jgi:3'-phosphoadenosine 5'-phosphosulfate sulfotransferase (PAPS reductase)/FAD synthetase
MQSVGRERRTELQCQLKQFSREAGEVRGLWRCAEEGVVAAGAVADASGVRKVEEHRTPACKQMKKVSVLADWTMAQVDAYAEAHAIPKRKLYARGYTSVGCELCAAVPDDPANPPAGRWGGIKLECGSIRLARRCNTLLCREGAMRWSARW